VREGHVQLKQIAGRYDVEREVGRGGMGSVWLCSDQVLGRKVALKQLGGFPGESSPHIARALREARSSAALSHPNVVSIFDAVEEGDHIWLVMEYLPSRTLSQIIKEEGAMPPERAARIGAQVADGLAAAHARNTVHRDVKPGNILVTEDDHAKISDFGIARTLGEDQLTQTGLVAGTPLYFSPELARGAHPSPAADVWALGASLYAAVEGEAPWPQQENPIAMLVHIAHNEPPSPQHAGPLAEVIEQMMTVDPEQRPSMMMARDRLREVAEGSGTAPPTLVADDLHATQVLPAGAAFAADTAEEPFAPEIPVAPPPPVVVGGSPDVRPRRSRTLVGLVVGVLVLAAAIGVGLLTGLGGGDDPRSPAAGGTGRSSSPRSDRSSDKAGTPDSSATAQGPAKTPDSSRTPTGSATKPVASTDDPAAFVKDYYALLPGDTQDAWKLLGQPMQDRVGSYGNYRGFWATINSVTVDRAKVVGDGAVEVSLTYVTDRGTEGEKRRITVADNGDGLEIVDDGTV
jgi:serine/threonine protein kinase